VTIILSNFSRAESNGTWTGGPPYYSPTLDDWISFDSRAAQAINGDYGGTWAPQDYIPIVFTDNFFVSGPTVILGDGAELKSTVSGAFQLTDTEWPVLGPSHSSQSRTVCTSCLSATVNMPSVGPSSAYPILPNVQYGSPQTVLVPGSVVVLTVPLRCHDGATLTSVVVNWIVSTSQPTPPTLPKFRVLQIDANGDCTAMSSSATGADANGFVSATVAAAGWFQNGAVQTCIVAVDTDNVIDNAEYEYVLEIQEQQGQTGFPFSAQVYAQTPDYVAITNVTPSGTQTVDGVSVSSGNVLLTNQTDPTQNGLWSVQSGSWTRYSVPLTDGAIFWVSQGAQLGRTYWQQPAIPNAVPLPSLWTKSTAYASGTIVAPCANSSGFGLVARCTTAGTASSTEPTWPNTAGATVTDGGVTWTMQANSYAQPYIIPLQDLQQLNTGVQGGFAAFGNIWLPVQCHFEDIADCRWD
jgi:hypothetical protein